MLGLKASLDSGQAFLTGMHIYVKIFLEVIFDNIFSFFSDLWMSWLSCSHGCSFVFIF